MSGNPLLRSIDTSVSAWAVCVRLAVALVFLPEGIQKLVFPEILGSGRFASIGIPWPNALGPFVGWVELVCGVLILLGLLTRLAAIPLVVTMVVAIVSTKIPIWARFTSLPSAADLGRSTTYSTGGCTAASHDEVRCAARGLIRLRAAYIRQEEFCDEMHDLSEVSARERLHHWTKLRDVLNVELMKRPNRAPNAETMFLDSARGQLEEAFKSAQADEIRETFLVERGTCVACHMAEQMAFLNDTPIFRNTASFPSN